jgi:actin, other eukaryote
MKQLKEDSIEIDLELSRSIKENYCNVSQDYDGTIKMIREGHTPKERVYKLPGTHRDIVIETETLIGTPEMLFHPQKQEDREIFGLHKALYESALKCDPDIRTQLLRNIVLAGGTSTMEGFKERVTKEVNAICSSLLQP